MTCPPVRAASLAAAALLASLVAACGGHTACIENVDPNVFYVNVVDGNANPLPGATVTYSYEGGAAKPCDPDPYSIGVFTCGSGSIGHYDITGTLGGQTREGSTDVDIGPCGPEAQPVVLRFE